MYTAINKSIKYFILLFGCLIRLYPTFAQFDTFFDPNGAYKVVNSQKFEMIYPNGLPIGKLLLEEYQSFDSQGNLIGECKVFGPGHYHSRAWSNSGVLIIDEYVNKEADFGYQIVNDTLGNSKHTQIFNRELKIQLDYYEGSNFLKSSTEIIKVPEQFDSLKISLPINNYYAVETRSNSQNITRIEKSTSYYSNGLEKSISNYVYRRFEIYKTSSAYEEKNEQPILIIDKIKDGIWKEFNQDGILINSTNYDINKSLIDALK
ncbi:MAG: hypothetical protein R2792_17300 [Saprospiraceae bacterium]